MENTEEKTRNDNRDETTWRRNRRRGEVPIRTRGVNHVTRLTFFSYRQVRQYDLKEEEEGGGGDKKKKEKDKKIYIFEEINKQKYMNPPKKKG